MRRLADASPNQQGKRLRGWKVGAYKYLEAVADTLQLSLVVVPPSDLARSHPKELHSHYQKPIDIIKRREPRSRWNRTMLDVRFGVHGRLAGEFMVYAPLHASTKPCANAAVANHSQALIQTDMRAFHWVCAHLAQPHQYARETSLGRKRLILRF